LINLNTIEENAPIYSESISSIKASLIWLDQDTELDLTLFYKTKDSEEGFVSSDSDTSDCSITYVDGGVEETDSSVCYEKFNITDTAKFESIYFIVSNYSDVVLNRDTKFKDYTAILKLSVQGSDTDLRITTKLSCEDPGKFLLVGKLYRDEGTLRFTNINKVMSQGSLKSDVPGAYKICF